MAKRKITLKNKGGDSLYPRTTAQVVEVNANENLTQFLAGIIQGTKTVGKATTADNATKAEKDSSDRVIKDTYAEKATTDSTLAAHDTRISTNTGDITQLKSDLNNLKAAATAAYVPKGSVQNVSELAYLTPGTLAKGHVYNIIEAGEFNDEDGTTRPFSAGANVVYIGPDGTETDESGIALTPDPTNTLNWDLLGGIVDMSSYITKDEAKGYATITALDTLEGEVTKNTTEITKIKEGTTTVPKATTAEKATKDSNGNTINFSKDGVETLLDLTYSDDGEVTY